jgi:uncharacterized protein (TIGR02145 family)
MNVNKLLSLSVISGSLLLTSCKEPTKEMLVTTGTVSNILINTADVTGKILDLGEGVTGYGHCYAKTPNTTVAETKTEIGNSAVVGGFTSNLKALEPGTKYYVKAYCSRGKVTVYGDEINFTTLSDSKSELTTAAITTIGKTTAVSGGTVTSEGGTPVTARGICWGLAVNPTVDNYKVQSGSGSGTYICTLTDLTPDKKYYVRAYATNMGGTAYGNELSFSTLPDVPVPPTVTTAVIASYTSNSAVCGGEVTNEGTSPVSARGVCWSTVSPPDINGNKSIDGGGPGSFVSNLTGLIPGTQYYLKAYATNSINVTSYGNERIFTTNCVVPAATTNPASNVGITTVTLNGIVNANGLSTTVTFEYGLSTSYSSTAAASPSPVTGSTNTTVSAELTGLTANALYHYRIKTVNCGGTTYGEDRTFTTTCTAPSASTNAANAPGTTTATLNGTVNANNFSTTVTFEYGLTLSYSNTATASQSPVSGSGNIAVSAGLNGLTTNTLYHFRVKAINCEGNPVYGNDMTFTTLASLTTAAILNITATTATSGGSVAAGGGASITDRGVCWSTNPGPTISGSKISDGPGTGDFTAGITGLTGNTTYYVRAYATNSAGTVYGNELNFRSGPVLPSVSTATVSSIAVNSASSGGTVTNDGGASVSARGVCWSTSNNPTIDLSTKTSNGSGIGSFTSSVTGLTGGYKYYLRAYATNSVGTSYGTETSFTTTLTDYEGNVYHPLTIGTQVWMAENLKTGKYRDGTTIPNVIDNVAWSNLTTGGWRDYGDIASNSVTYGRLYNWYAASDARNICPAGWHVPNNSDWTTLESYLIAGGYNYDGSTLGNKYAKSLASTILWNASAVTGSVGNTDYPALRNKSGFSALPGGIVNGVGNFYYIGTQAWWWSATPYGSGSGWSVRITYDNIDVARAYYTTTNAFSVRCLKD